MSHLTVALWVTLCAAPPTAVVEGPNRALPGDLVVLDASRSQAAGFAWVLADSDKTFLAVDDGRRVVFATARPGRYTFVLVAATAEASGAPRVALARHVVEIGAPPPGPGPAPDPPAPLPPGRFGLAEEARRWAGAVSLPPADRLRTARLVAGNFETVSTAIAAGAVKNVDAALAQLVAANQSALAASEYAAWKNDWNPSFRAAMQKLDEAGRLATLTDVADAFREIAAGLNAVAAQANWHKERL